MYLFIQRSARKCRHAKRSEQRLIQRRFVSVSQTGRRELAEAWASCQHGVARVMTDARVDVPALLHGDLFDINVGVSDGRPGECVRVRDATCGWFVAVRDGLRGNAKMPQSVFRQQLGTGQQCCATLQLSLPAPAATDDHVCVSVSNASEFLSVLVVTEQNLFPVAGETTSYSQTLIFFLFPSVLCRV